MSHGPAKRWMAQVKTLTATPVKRALKQTPVVAHPAAGLDLASRRPRASMVERLGREGISDRQVLAAMGRIPRHQFVDQGLASRAYEDSALPIGHEQSISQPYIVARMTEVLCANRHLGRVLEIGTGCGYQAAILACCVDEVYSIERIRALYDRARANLRPLRLSNLRLVLGDGLNGIPEAAPFDGMLIAAAATDLPEKLLMQLAIGGRAIAPLGAGANQTLCLIERTGEKQFSRILLDRVRFVPLLSGVV